MEDTMFKYTYRCPACGYDCETWFYEQPHAKASFTCCCENDIIIDVVDTEKAELICSSLKDIYIEYIEGR